MAKKKELPLKKLSNRSHPQTKFLRADGAGPDDAVYDASLMSGMLIDFFQNLFSEQKHREVPSLTSMS